MDEDGKIVITKSSTTPKELTEGVHNCFLKAGKTDMKDVEQMLHGSTTAINTIIQRVGARTALITTRGFRDSYEIGRGTRYDSWNLFFHRAVPLVPREHRLEVSERLNARGEILVPLAEDELVGLIEFIKEEQFEAVALCFLHSYVNPVHEQRAAEILRRELPDVFVSVSSELIRKMREYERTSTTVLNAYIGPVVNAYVNRLEKRMRDGGSKGSLLVMQSNGGAMSVDVAAQQPVQTTESGTACGVIGARYLAEILQLPEVVAFDMGGTTAKTSLIRNYLVPVTQDALYIGGLHEGQPLMGSVVDIFEIGAGGGSIAWRDEFGSLNVGPRSAGADPGPACYGLGNTEPTVTDANLALGRLNGKNFLGGQMGLSEDIAREAVKTRVADKFGLDVDKAADAILQIVTNSMSLAVRRISVEKGVDPRDCAIVAFGGAGPLHACAVAKNLNIPKVVIPQMPGNFSAVGMLVADLRHDYLRSFLTNVKKADIAHMIQCFHEFEEQGTATLLSEGAHKDTIKHALSLDMRYVGQNHVLSAPLTFEELEAGNIEAVVMRYHDIHKTVYGHSALGEQVEVVNLKIISTGWPQKERPVIFKPLAKHSGTPTVGERMVYWPDAGWQKSKIYQREELGAGFALKGPAIVEEYASTTAVFPGCSLTIDKIGNMIMEVV